MQEYLSVIFPSEYASQPILKEWIARENKEVKAGDKKNKPDSSPPGARKEGADKAKESAEKKEEDLKRLGM